MKHGTSIRIFWICCLFAAGASPGSAQTEPHQDFICTSGGSTRIISVFNHGGSDGQARAGSCRVDYTKEGQTKTLYTSKTGRAYCAAKAALLVTNLSKGNYSCRARTLEQPDEAESPEKRPQASDPTH